MDKKISLTVEQWVALQEQSPDGTGQIPVWFQVTGGSMMPFVRPFRDNVIQGWRLLSASALPDRR